MPMLLESSPDRIDWEGTNHENDVQFGFRFLVSCCNNAAGGTTNEDVLTLGLAKRLVAAAEDEAKKRGATVVIAVVDDGGQLILLERLDDTQVASVEVAIGKARTAAIFRRPSKVFEDQVKDGRVAALALPGATPLQGGIPIAVEGKVIGAIGASGNSPRKMKRLHWRVPR
jgi:glc operon protein GlcG